MHTLLLNKNAQKYLNPCFILLLLIACTQPQQKEKPVQQAQPQEDRIYVRKDDTGMTLVVEGKELMVNGMNWDYFPRGTNYEYNLWEQSEEFIAKALQSEMSALRDMGVNAVRIYTGIPSKWIQHIYEEYGIYTMLNHPFGRYGLSIDGKWVENTEYSDPGARRVLLEETTALAREYKGTPGLLLYLLGNENNFGLFWEGAETEDIPEQNAQSLARARAMYRVFNEAALAIKEIDDSRPVAMCNGDLLFMDIIVEECQGVDIFGANVYRGLSFGDLFDRVRDEFGKPVLFTEFGGDAFHALEEREDQQSQALYDLANWQDIYENAAGLGRAGNAIGGFTFQFTDGWWKFGQTKNLDVHDTNASWANGGYSKDYEEGQNNMNEEWFGICGKGETTDEGFYELQPRAAYYALKEAHKLNPYQEGMTLDGIRRHFSGIAID